jgi:dTDP-4-dehydro-6-deoxy-alpha-D-glucopyranose 2,3-dehydratase
MNDIQLWFDDIKKSSRYAVSEIPFGLMDQWYFDSSDTNLRHRGGKFYSIEGIRVITNYGKIQEWEQPIINQPEIGILGILTKIIDGERKYLMQAKMEPGNINTLQLSPTVQATESNYKRAHNGKKTIYLEYFLGQSDSVVIFDQLQTEQGGRFYKKRNRNMLVEVTKDIDPNDDFRWMNLYEIGTLFHIDNFVNMDSRSVLCCVVKKEAIDNPVYTTDEILNWITKLMVKYSLTVKLIGLKHVKSWIADEGEIKHTSGSFFQVNSVKVEASTREVTRWTQPMIKNTGEGLVGFLVAEINDTLHFLARGIVEVGNIDVMHMAPTVQCSMYKQRFSEKNKCFPYVDIFLSSSENILYDQMQSEEGGRFYHCQNRHMIVKVDDYKNLELRDDYIWVSYNQVLDFVRYGYFNVEGRSLMSCFGLTEQMGMNND